MANKLGTIRSIAALFVAASVCACTSLPAGDGHRDLTVREGKGHSLQGYWDGRLPLDDTRVNKEVRLRILARGDKVRVWTLEQTQWIEVMPGKYSWQGQGDEAVISATDEGKDDDGRWVETWTMTLREDSALQLSVDWTRVVDNLDLPKEHKNSHWSAHAKGNLQRQRLPPCEIGDCFDVPTNLRMEVTPNGSTKTPISLDATELKQMVEETWEPESRRVLDQSKLPTGKKYSVLILRSMSAEFERKDCRRLNLLSIRSIADSDEAKPSAPEFDPSPKEIWTIDACGKTEQLRAGE